MRALPLLLVALVAAAPASSAGTRTDSRAYLATAGDVLVDCGWTPLLQQEVGGGCFVPRPTEDQATLVVDDANVPRTAAHFIVTKAGRDVAWGDFCGSTTVDLPTGSDVVVHVFVYVAHAALVCEGALPATSGVVHATFRIPEVAS